MNNALDAEICVRQGIIHNAPTEDGHGHLTLHLCYATIADEGFL